MGAKTFTKGEIVVAKTDREYIWGKGEVIRIFPNGTIMVRFGNDAARQLDLPGWWEARKVNASYDPSDLIKYEDWTAEMLFGKTYMFVGPLGYPFSTDAICMHNECDSKSSRRIMVNCLGSVHELDVCDEHSSYHGKLIEDFPFSAE